MSGSFKDLHVVEKAQIVLSYSLRFVLLLAIIGAILHGRLMVTFLSITALVFSFLPALLGKNFKVHLPSELELSVVFFLYASLFLGEAEGYYTKFYWWDMFLHTFSGILLGFLGFTILFVLYEEKRIAAKPITISIMSFFFALGMGALWEIFEFFMDQTFNLNMQRNSLVDTMSDLIVDALGALMTSAIGFMYLKGKKNIFGTMIDRFIRKNPGIYGKYRKIR